MKKLDLENFKDVEIKKSKLVAVTGGTSTTLMIEVGCTTENEYEDTNGNGEFDEEDTFSHVVIKKC